MSSIGIGCRVGDLLLDTKMIDFTGEQNGSSNVKMHKVGLFYFVSIVFILICNSEFLRVSTTNECEFRGVC